MRKFLLILATVLTAFLAEQVLARFVGSWFMPDLTLVVVIFFNLSRGTRNSLMAAVIAGLIKDSFLPRGFGTYLFAFICDVYITSIMRFYFYQAGSMFSRILMVAFILVLHNHILFFLTLMSFPVRYSEMFRYILIPELWATVAVTVYVFEKFKRCVLRYFV